MLSSLNLSLRPPTPMSPRSELELEETSDENNYAPLIRNRSAYNPFSSVDRTISRDSTGGECAKNAELLAEYGRKHRRTTHFDIFHLTEAMESESFLSKNDISKDIEDGFPDDTGDSTPSSRSKLDSADKRALTAGTFDNQQPGYTPGPANLSAQDVWHQQHVKVQFYNDLYQKFSFLQTQEQSLRLQLYGQSQAYLAQA